MDERREDVAEAFFAWLGQPRPRYVCRMPGATPYEGLLAQVERGDPAIAHALQASRGLTGLDDAAILAQWRQHARDERAALRTFIALRHVLAPAPGAKALAALEHALDGAADALLDWYRRHDGGHLFADHASGGGGLTFFAIADMDDERGDVLAWFEDDDDTETARPDWLGASVVFAGFTGSSTRFALATSGPGRGGVFVFDHDAMAMQPVASSFDQFLDAIRNDPVASVAAHGNDEYVEGYAAGA